MLRIRAANAQNVCMYTHTQPHSLTHSLTHNNNNNKMRTFSLYIPNRSLSIATSSPALRIHVEYAYAYPDSYTSVSISVPFDLKYILYATKSESNCRHVVVR